MHAKRKGKLPMTSAQQQRVKELFDEVFELPADTQKERLAQLCPDDGEVRAAVEQLLCLPGAQAEFLETHSAAELLGLPTTELPLLAPGRQLGPYRLLREIGQGGGGAVYLAERADGTYAQQVAIKLVWPGFGSEALRRFQQEREILARLTHPNIARLLDGGATAEGWHYLVMEYIEGQPLTTYCRAQRLALPARLKLFRAVCAAVQYAHQNLIVHRDLKPSNILVTQDGTAKLLDFGIAKLLERGSQPSTLTGAGLQPFTPLYASPEQIRNEPITTASDVYSLGVLLYELLTGVRPYRVDNAAPPEQMRAVCEEEPTRPSLRVTERMRVEGGGMKDGAVSSLIPHPSSLRGDLDNIVLKALRKEPTLRYATVEQLSDDVQRHLDGEPVTARPATWRYRAGKYVQRNKAFVAAASMLVLALIVGALVTLWQLRASLAREHEQRREQYSADMRQAGADWDEGNLVQMDELLERHRPGNGVDEEWRGFEWFALWKLLHVEVRSFPLSNWFSGPCLTPDGKTLLVAQGTKIEIWEALTGRYVGLLAETEEGTIRLLLSSDGAKVASLGSGGQVKLWDLVSKRLLAVIPHAGNLNKLLTRDRRALIFSPDSKRLAVRYNDAPLEEWWAETGQLIRRYPLPVSLELPPDGPALYTPDGRLICLGRKGNRWHLWEAQTNRTIAQLDPQSSDPKAFLPYYPLGHLFSHDGTRYYLATTDFLVRAWEVKTGKLVQVFRGHRDNIETPALSFDDKYLATGSDDRTLRLWDTHTGRCLAIIKNESQTFLPSFSADGHLAASCMRGFRAKVWDVPQLLVTPVALDGVTTFGVSPDGATIFTAESGVPSLRQLATGRILFKYPKVHTGIFFPAESPDTLLRITADNFDQQSVERIAWESGKIVATSHTNHKGSIRAFCSSPDGTMIATSGFEDSLIKLWNPQTWREIAQLQGHTSGITSCAFSPDGRQLATSGLDDTIRIWDVARHTEQATLRGHSSWVWQVCFSPDGKTLASAGMDFTVKLWDAVTGKELRTLRGHANSVYCLAFSPDGSRLASGGDDQTVHLWDWRTGKELTVLRGHNGKLGRLFFSPDGRTLVSSGEDGTRIWRTATEAEVRAHH